MSGLEVALDRPLLLDGGHCGFGRKKGRAGALPCGAGDGLLGAGQHLVDVGDDTGRIL